MLKKPPRAAVREDFLSKGCEQKKTAQRAVSPVRGLCFGSDEQPDGGLNVIYVFETGEGHVGIYELKAVKR